MAFTKDSPAYKQLLQFNSEQTKFLAGFLRDKGKVVKIPDSMRSKGSNISLYLIEKPTDMQGVTVRVDLWVNRTNNILIEAKHKRRQLDGQIKAEAGWFYTCQAHHLFVIDPLGNKIYQFNWRLLKAFVAQNGPHVELKTWKNKTDDDTETSAYMVKLAVLRRERILTGEWEIE